MTTNVYLTIDTEHSMGGAWADSSLRPVPTERHIHCRINGEDYGIGWLCHELGRHNFRATFFSEMFASLIFGCDDTKAWCQYLLERGQDVQLHTHLNFYYYAQHQTLSRASSARTDDLSALPTELRGELLEQACELFHAATGYYPVAYRAGNWQANLALVADLKKIGIRLDSSFNATARHGGSFHRDGVKLNVLQKLNGMWELPLTVLKQSLPEPHLIDGMRPFDLVSLSTWEIRKALDDAYRASIPHLVAVLHNFSGVKVKDPQYLTMKPDRVVRARLRFFLDYLASHSDRFRVSTCGELVSELDNVQPVERVDLPQLGLIHPLARKIVQAVNSIYWL